MAIDSRDKRASTVQFQTPGSFSPPLADGTIGTADRVHAAYSYAGITAATPAVVPDRAFRQFVPGFVRIPGNCARSRRSAAAAAVKQITPPQLLVASVSPTADVYLDPQDQLVLVASTISSSDVYLPAATAVPEGTVIEVKNDNGVGSFDLKVSGGGTIDGGSGTVSFSANSYGRYVAATPASGTRQWFDIT